MREPFLLTFIAISLWGFADWLMKHKSKRLMWMAIGFVGMLMVSPAIALATLVIFAGWIYLRGDHKRIPWQALVALIIIFIIALFVLSWSLNLQSRFWHCVSGRRDLRLVPRLREVGYVSPRTRLGLDSVVVQKNEYQRTIIVCDHLRFIATSSTCRVHRADHVDLENHRHPTRSGMVCSFAFDDLQSDCGMAHTARTGAPCMALDC